MAHDRLVTWLKDAHSMEKAIGEFAQHIQKHHENEAGLGNVLRSVINTSHEHESTVESLLSEENVDASSGKDLVGRLTSFISGAGSNLFHDDDVKDTLVLHAVLHFAHACYVSLAAGAELKGETNIAMKSRELADAKRDLADRVLDVIPSVTERELNE